MKKIKENLREAEQMKMFGITPNPVERCNKWDGYVVVNGVKYYGEVKSMASHLTQVSVSDRLSYKAVDLWDQHRDWWLFSTYDAELGLPTAEDKHILVTRSQIQPQYDICRATIAKPGTVKMGADALDELLEDIKEHFPAAKYSANPDRKRRIDDLINRGKIKKASFNWTKIDELGNGVRPPQGMHNLLGAILSEHGKL